MQISRQPLASYFSLQGCFSSYAGFFISSQACLYMEQTYDSSSFCSNVPGFCIAPAIAFISIFLKILLEMIISLQRLVHRVINLRDFLWKKVNHLVTDPHLSQMVTFETLFVLDALPHLLVLIHELAQTFVPSESLRHIFNLFFNVEREDFGPP